MIFTNFSVLLRFPGIIPPFPTFTPAAPKNGLPVAGGIRNWEGPEFCWMNQLHKSWKKAGFCKLFIPWRKMILPLNFVTWLAGRWMKMDHLKMYLLPVLTMVIFQCHASFQGGNLNFKLPTTCCYSRTSLSQVTASPIRAPSSWRRFIWGNVERAKAYPVGSGCIIDTLAQQHWIHPRSNMCEKKAPCRLRRIT